MRTEQYRSGEAGLELLELLGLLWLHRSQEKLVESGGRGCMCNTSRAVFNKLLLGSVCVRACVLALMVLGLPKVRVHGITGGDLISFANSQD